MAITVGSVEVDVIPNTRGIYARLNDGLVPAATRVGDDMGRVIGQRITVRLVPAIRDGINAGARAARPEATRQGDQTGGAFSRAMKTRLEAAFRSLPKINIDADTSEADADLQALRVRMETLAGKRIGIDVDAAAAKAEITDIEEQLRRLGAAHPNVAVRADTAKARAELAAVREEIDRVSANPGHIRLETDGTLGQRLRAQVQAAEASLPNINIGADTSQAEVELARLRGQLTALRDQRIGIDIDAATALARVSEIQGRLQRLSASDADVSVRVDAANAMAQLAVVQAMVTRLDGQTARVNVDTSGAVSAILHLTVAFAGLMAIPAIPVLAAGVGAVGSAAVAAGAGVGALAAVAVPAFVNIAGALQAQKAAQDAATNATIKGAQAGGQGAARALQMAGAQQALASAERNGARQIAQAQQQVRQAKTAAADAIVQAAQRNAQAARAIEDAERDLARSQQDAKRAQEDLTDARREAAQELEDLNSRLAGAQLSQRDAVLGVREAQAELNRTMADGGASDIDRQRAQLAYDQAVQRLKEQTTETRRLKTETESANKAGVEGSDTVRSAQDRLGQAQQQVADRTRAVGDAQAEAARTQVETSRQVAQAQERVGEATANVAVAQQSAADAVASAQRQIASASASAAGGVDQAAVAQAKYRAELAKMTPAARGTFNAVLGLRTAFTAWSRSLQPEVMPLFTRAIIGLKNSLPGLTPFVIAAAKAIGILQDRASARMKSPWWLQFKKDLAGAVIPAIVGLGSSVARVFAGMGGIVSAFLPHMDSISARMQAVTGRFANWGKSLKGSPEFERFLAYSARMGPVLARSLGDISSAFYQMAKATSPLSGPVLQALGAVARAVASIATTLPWLIQLVYLAWIATKLWTLSMIVFNAVLNMNPILRIVLLVIALVAAVIYAYKHFAWFRTIVDAVWSGLKTGALWVWNTVLKPVFSAISTALRAVGAAASWVWNTILRPVFSFIGTAARILATIVLTVLVIPFVLAFKLLAAVASWVWRTVLSPVFGWIADKAVWLWQTRIKPVWDLMRAGFQLLANKVKELWDRYARPIFQWIGDKAVWLWTQKIKPTWEFIKIGMGLLGAKVKELWEKYAKPVFGWIGDKAVWLWNKGIKPSFDNIKSAVGLVADSFGKAKDAIGRAWSQVQDIAKKPVRFIIDKIYNAGIVPTWNKIANAFGAPPLKEMVTKGWARGGILPGTSSYRNGDDQMVPMRRGEGVYVSEAMRNPYERARLHAVNSAAMNGKSLSPYQGFAEGGIFDWVKGTASKTVDLAKSGVSWLKDGVKASATAGLNAVVKPLLNKIAGSKSLYRDMITGIPKKMISSIVNFSGQADSKLGAVGIGSGGFKSALQWAKTQNGLPYQWAGNGNPSWDCSGLVSAIESVIRGQRPHRRWATGSFSGKTAPADWHLNGKSPYMIGITNAGVGHTAGTLNGVNVESRGGDGVVIGSRARSYKDSLFTHQYAYRGKYDQGGYLQPGLNLAYNGTGRPEPVFTNQQASALTRIGATSTGPTILEGDLYLDSGEFMGKVRGTVHQELRPVVSALNAKRRG